jgi:hypothetical protein
VLGNAYQESSWNPASVGDGGGGLWGFTAGAISLDSLQSYAASKGVQWTNPTLQAEFLVKNLSQSDIAGLNAQTTPAAAASWFMNNWEHPLAATENEARRQLGAEIAFKEISGDTTPAAAPAQTLDAALAVDPGAGTGGAISVSSPLLTSGQEAFAGRLAQLTGLDPRVVSAWALAEESGSAAAGRQSADNFNWLNIGYFDSGTGQIAFDKAFSHPLSAAEQTSNFLHGTWGGASSSIRAILNAAGQTPNDQMMAIANSDWAGSHYGNGAELESTYNELSGLTVTRDQ